ncbi:4-amino-4-deoxy-L-arabinose-phospho-UDP flippase [Erwinia rhapontici]|uniref:4-amino-4-deoxy-L-arabinose-phosphoundecaprenol flippase subunit ArnF n=1 Tax=Erwinia rhapontici TaxID=55212 RepID=UPI001D0DAAE8|nr:4-amino-4-deoxy-L-arabinose-phosphoundecaprenol flippase subunit ArnF [Erwinia rhapontici]UDQ81398.1 4-amino-4-deoxy-L-arabinose-phospho-UDP flippase [Erwinia rhapontici]
MGLLYAFCSVLLISAAQLMMKWAMVQLPAIDQLALFSAALLSLSLPTLVLSGGLLAYALSMMCWLLALQRLPLSRVYPLLSLSYLLVWTAALWLPGMNEVFLWGKLVGAVLILAGLLLIFWPGKKAHR